MSTRLCEPDESVSPSPLTRLRARLDAGETNPRDVAAESLARANSNAAQNVYLALDPDRVLREADGLWSASGSRPALFGVPVSLKDCFDLTGYLTSCGAHFYAMRNGVATADSAVAAVLRRQDAIVIGKTHLHQLAYGITGENADYGDCAQPSHPNLLTGGSSSGGAASVQEGSVVAAIGTDTGGSIRVPAALCGLAGYRSSHGTRLRNSRPDRGPVAERDAWQGAAHLAPSFDTIGWLFRDLRDGPALAKALFEMGSTPDAMLPPATGRVMIGAVGREFVHDCDLTVLDVFEAWTQRLARLGAQVETISESATSFWSDAFEIFAGIQAHEASILHRGNFDKFLNQSPRSPRVISIQNAGAAEPLRLSRSAVRAGKFVAAWRGPLRRSPTHPAIHHADESRGKSCRRPARHQWRSTTRRSQGRRRQAARLRGGTSGRITYDSLRRLMATPGRGNVTLLP
jgi:Asp-tRNA(Asn)/Glu-tRNA(Gln) amidotransferase A subunit family amidase